MLKKLKERWLGRLVGATLTTGTGLFIYYFDAFPPFKVLINASYDLPFLQQRLDQPKEVVMVYMDDDSHSELNQPYNRSWDRGVHARLLERMTAERAQAVVYDVVFSDLNPEHPDGDQRFARAIKANGRVILAADYQPTQTGGTKVTPPTDPFLDAAAGWGLDSVLQDQDFMVRRHLHVPPAKDDDRYSSLSWEATKLIGAPITQDPNQRYLERWVNYYGPPETIPAVSFRLALEPNQYCPAGFFRNKVVFVGAYLRVAFSGQRKDELRSPYTRGNQFIPVLDVQATQFLNLVHQDWLIRIPSAIQLLAIGLSGILFGVGLAALQPWVTTRTALLSALAISLLAHYLFLQHRLWFSWLVIVAAQIPVATLYSIVLNSFQLFLQKRLLEHSLALHLPPKRIKQFVQRPELLKPGAEKQMLSIMFTDIENFTKLSEGMDPDDLARVMNEYFQTTIPCVHQAEGAVIKLIGDAILAVWNAPDPQPNHSELACSAAILLHSQEVKFSGKQAGLKLRTRIGVHTGLANVGNFGSTTRIDYTAIGENVNLASRLEGLNKYLGTDILATRETLHGCRDQIVSRLAGLFRLKGFEKLVEVHELVGLRDAAEATKAWRQTFGQALKEFQRKNLDAAEAGFRCTLEMRANDGPAKFYLHQIAELRVHPPAPDWAGEIELKEK